MENQHLDDRIIENQTSSLPSQSRRNFLSYAGVSASALLLASSCKKEIIEDWIKTPGEVGGRDGLKAVVDLGSGDIGILNYAYALEQLEAAFYIQVTNTPYSGISDREMEYLSGIRDHEIAHREFFKNALGTKRIGGLITNFSAVNFKSRESVLTTAKAFEDLGVSAYNGAGELLESCNYLTIAGKIVSVEARHAAAIRDLISYGSFADSTVVDDMGLDVYRKPPEVLGIASDYIVTKIIANNLPTS